MTNPRDDDRDAIIRLSEDVIRLYMTRDRDLIGRLYTRDDEAPPIIIDVGNSFVDGLPWVKSQDTWAMSLKHYFNLMESDNDTPRVTYMRYIEPEIVVDQTLAAFVSLLAIGLQVGTEEREQMTRYTLVLRKFDGSWKIWNEHFSAALSQEIILGSAGNAPPLNGQ